jgi:hypothetical protein
MWKCYHILEHSWTRETGDRGVWLLRKRQSRGSNIRSTAAGNWRKLLNRRSNPSYWCVAAWEMCEASIRFMGEPLNRGRSKMGRYVEDRRVSSSFRRKHLETAQPSLAGMSICFCFPFSFALVCRLRRRKKRLWAEPERKAESFGLDHRSY